VEIIPNYVTMLTALMNIIPYARTTIILPHVSSIPVIKLFGVAPFFILKFFGEIILLFLISALISYILKLDKASRE
jgi:hypothetical protein